MVRPGSGNGGEGVGTAPGPQVGVVFEGFIETGFAFEVELAVELKPEGQVLLVRGVDLPEGAPRQIVFQKRSPDFPPGGGAGGVPVFDLGPDAPVFQVIDAERGVGPPVDGPVIRAFEGEPVGVAGSQRRHQKAALAFPVDGNVADGHVKNRDVLHLENAAGEQGPVVGHPIHGAGRELPVGNRPVASGEGGVFQLVVRFRVAGDFFPGDEIVFGDSSPRLEYPPLLGFGVEEGAFGSQKGAVGLRQSHISHGFPVARFVVQGHPVGAQDPVFEMDHHPAPGPDEIAFCILGDVVRRNVDGNFSLRRRGRFLGPCFKPGAEDRPENQQDF